MDSNMSLCFDFYQFSMAYTYWKSGKFNDIAVFNLYFRTPPFGGTFAILGGISEAIEFVSKFHFDAIEIEKMKQLVNGQMGLKYEDKFFEYLLGLNSSQIIMEVIEEGSVVFPNIPLIQITGPIVMTQLLETQLLYLIGHPTLVATNARRIRQAVSHEQKLFEFGLRRSQGLSGGMNASKYSWIGGFDGTSNISAGIKYGIPVVGTHAHSYVMAWSGLDEIDDNLTLSNPTDPTISTNNFKQFVFDVNQTSLDLIKTNKAELASFIMYAWTQPNNFLALIDTYNVLQSGLENYCMVSNALIILGFKPKGVRIDSGDLSWLSIGVKQKFDQMSQIYSEYLNMIVVVSNDLDENIVKSLIEEGARVNTFGIGTDISSSKRSPALGVVYKLVAINESPRIKISEDVKKSTIPGKKYVYRLFGQDGLAILDLMTNQAGIENLIDDMGQITCVDPKNPLRHVKVQYYSHKELLTSVLVEGTIKSDVDLSAKKAKLICDEQIQTIRPDHLRILNPTPYKISVGIKYMELIKELFDAENITKVI